MKTIEELERQRDEKMVILKAIEGEVKALTSEIVALDVRITTLYREKEHGNA